MKSVMEKEQEISELRGSQDRLEEEILQLRNENLVIDKTFFFFSFINVIHTYIHTQSYFHAFSYLFIHTYMHTYWYTNLLTYPIWL